MEEKMIYTYFKLVGFSNKFIHKDIEYIKTSFNRGYYYKNNKKVFRNFKKKILVQTDGNNWDFPPIIKGK